MRYFALAFLLAACSTTTTVTVASSPSTTVTYSPSPLQDPPSSSSSSSSPPFRLSKQDIDLGVKTTQKQCFGSAGCNVTVRVTVSMDKADAEAMAESDRYQVTFKITGDDSGPVIDNLTLYGNGKYSLVEEYLSTQSSGAPITITPTSVLKLR